MCVMLKKFNISYFLNIHIFVVEIYKIIPHKDALKIKIMRNGCTSTNLKIL